jgi:ribosomal protein S12 methylthiotransferase
MAREPRILPYLDIPIQHASDAVLARMRRPEREHTIREKVDRVRETVPDVAIRTTCIVGFPGETEEDFATLLRFLEEVQFDRVGAFTYSAQEGTRAAAMEDDVPESVKRERLERLMELQRQVTAERFERHLGRTVPAIVDRVDADCGTAQLRTIWQADDVDGVTHVEAPALQPGALVDVRLDEVVDDYDFAATLVRVTSAPPAPVARGRALPVMAAATIGTYGR